jgi:folate-binding protein YgfZ
MTFASHLTYRTLFRISGADRRAFLQGIVSNDLQRVGHSQAIYAALLTPQGKFLHDMIISEEGEALFIECESARADDLIKRLQLYKLRSKVTFEALSDQFNVWALWKGAFPPQSFLDPRLSELGARLYLKKDQKPEQVSIVEWGDYDRYRLSLGITEGSKDMEIEKTTLVEGNFDFLGGIDWKKGCYIGQELTARMHYRALVKKRLFPVHIEGPTPPYGDDLEGVGEMRSSSDNHGMALLRIDAVLQALDQKSPLTYGETKLWPQIPSWMKIDVPPASR